LSPGLRRGDEPWQPGSAADFRGAKCEIGRAATVSPHWRGRRRAAAPGPGVAAQAHAGEAGV